MMFSGGNASDSAQLTSFSLHMILLLTIQPAEQRGKQHPQEEHVNHGGRVYLPDPVVPGRSGAARRSQFSA